MAITGDTLARIALDAGKLIMDIYEGDFDFTKKGDDSPVTLADEKAEALILKALAEADPELQVIAEEAMAAGQMPEHGPRFALVDPLDGTKEFINKNGEFTEHRHYRTWPPGHGRGLCPGPVAPVRGGRL